jgi:hypothetical protein
MFSTINRNLEGSSFLPIIEFRQSKIKENTRRINIWKGKSSGKYGGFELRMEPE